MVLTASKCLSAFKVRKLVTDCQPNGALEANKFIFSHIWGLTSEHYQSYWMRYGLESEPKAIKKYESTTNSTPQGFGSTQSSHSLVAPRMILLEMTLSSI